MTEDIRTFEQMIEKYDFAIPLSEKTRNHAVRSKKKIYAAALKKSGEYGIIIFFVSSVFFFFKKLGIGVSFLNAGIISLLTSAAIVTSAATGTYVVVKKLSRPDVNIEKKEETETEKGTLPEDKGKNSVILPANKLEQLKPEKIIKTMETEGAKLVIVSAFRTDPESKILSKKLTGALIEELEKLNKNLNVVRSSVNSGKRAGISIIGSVEFFNNEFIINSKIVDITSSKIISYDTIKIKDELYINMAVKKLSNSVTVALARNTKGRANEVK